MPELENKPVDDEATEVALHKRTVSRREFLKLAGIAGAAVGMGAGLGGLVAACGEETTTTTAGGGTGTTGGESTTTVSASGEKGDEIKVGWVAPITGSLASFGVPDNYLATRWTEFVGEGVVCGDGKIHPIKIMTTDSQSDSNRSAQVTGDLINNEGVHVVMAASTPDTTIGASDQCEALETPCITCDTPWQAWFYGRNGDPANPFKWTYHVFWGLEDLQAIQTAIWDQLPNNKVVGALWPNDADGNAFRPAWTPYLQEKGYKLVDPGAFQGGTEDYTQQISLFKKEGIDILTGVVQPPDFTNFWKQAIQQAMPLKISSVGKALLFPQSVQAIGDIADGQCTELWWHKDFPFKSSLTGETCAELAADYEARTGEQWTSPVGIHHIVFEEVVDCLKRCADPLNKEEFMKAVKSMKFDSIAGPIDFSSPVADGTLHPVENVYKSPLAGAQWLKTGNTKTGFEEVIVTNAAAPMVTVAAAPKLLEVL